MSNSLFSIQKEKMNTYYNPEDLLQFGNMGEDVPEMW